MNTLTVRCSLCPASASVLQLRTCRAEPAFRALGWVVWGDCNLCPTCARKQRLQETRRVAMVEQQAVARLIERTRAIGLLR